MWMFIGFIGMITLAITAALVFNRGCHKRPYPLMDENYGNRDKDL
jgi:hypothetical protein